MNLPDSPLAAFCHRVTEAARRHAATSLRSPSSAALSGDSPVASAATDWSALREDLSEVVAFYAEVSQHGPVAPHPDHPQLSFTLGPVDLYVYDAENAVVNLSIPAQDDAAPTTANEWQRGPRPGAGLSLKQYLEELEGLELDEVPPNAEPVDRPRLMDVFDAPCFVVAPEAEPQHTGTPLRQQRRALERIFAHQHIRQPLALLETPTTVFAAYLALPCLSNVLAFQPRTLNQFKLQFIAFQLQSLESHFRRLGCDWPFLDLRNVYLDEGWWVQVQLPLVGADPALALVDGQSPFRAWVTGEIDNYTYLLHLNRMAGRTFYDVHFHPVLPWITDFSTYSPGDPVGLRDLTRTKYRLKKGDEQLDMLFMGEPPHHITSFLTDLSFGTYRARRLPRAVLRRHVRVRFTPSEVPTTAEAMYAWTADECIPEWFSDPSIFRSAHPDMPDLELPPWAKSPEELVAKHRALLESPAVTAKLHQWIDLVFGFRLTGFAGIEAKNVALALAHPDSSFVTPHHGVRQLFRHPHPARLPVPLDDPDLGAAVKSVLPATCSLDDLERIASFDTTYFAGDGTGITKLPLPTHPSLPHLYAFVRAARRQPAPTSVAWPAMPLSPDAMEVLLHHAQRVMPLADLMERAWLKMGQSLFLAFFVPRVHLAHGHPARVSLPLAMRYFGPDTFVTHLWPAVSRALLDREQHIYEGAFLIQLGVLLGPVYTRTKLLPVLTMMMRQGSPVVSTILGVSNALGAPYTRQVILPHLVRELTSAAASEVALRKIAPVFASVFERLANLGVDGYLAATAGNLVAEASARRSVPLMALALEIGDLLLPSVFAVCEDAVSNPASTLATDAIMTAAYSLGRASLGHDRVRDLYPWADAFETQLMTLQAQKEGESSPAAPRFVAPPARISASLPFSMEDVRSSRSSSVVDVALGSRASSISGSSKSLARPASDEFASHIWSQSNEFQGKLAWSFPSGHTGLSAVGYLPHFRQLATGGKDKTVRLWQLDATTRGVDPLSSLQATSVYSLHQDPVTEVCGLGHLVVSCDGSIHAWDAETCQPVAQVKAKSTLSLVQPWADLRLLVGAASNGTLFMNDLRTRSAPIHYATGASFQGNLSAIAVSAKTGVAAAGSSMGSISLLDVHMGSLLACWRAHDSAVTKLLYMDDLLVSVAHGDNALYVWNVGTFVLHKAIRVPGLADISHLHAVSDSLLLVMDSAGTAAKVQLGTSHAGPAMRWREAARVTATASFLDGGSVPMWILGSADGLVHGLF
ncbi:hypothetical protein H9P43_001611 [Blastocladiella emersonii ATCC 22665]|nr:hypothetical protein H9P43_001611 [Blastocladiella emersonii ATCC 22665]